MINNITMRSKDAVQASLAECYVTIAGERYNFMQALSVDAKVNKTKKDVPILGRSMKGSKAVGMKGTGSAKFHFNTSIFRKVMQHYKETGEDLYFDMQITNEDPTSAAGRQTATLIDCNIDGLTLTKFDADGDFLEEEFDFTFEDWNMPEEFKLLDGMKA